METKELLGNSQFRHNTAGILDNFVFANLQQVYHQGETLYRVVVDGFLRKASDIGSIFQELRAKPLYEKHYTNADNSERLFANEHGLIWASCKGGGAVAITCIGYNKGVLDELIGRIRHYLVPRPPSGNIMILANGTSGMALVPAALTRSSLEVHNYSAEVVNQFNHASSCLDSPDPCGRLVILDGPPGTGKSYMIRAWACDVKALFVLVPATLIGEISGPSIIPLLLSYRIKDKPIVLIIEDADAALIDRRRGQLGSLASLLNLGDGLIGELADIRVIATTNARRVDLDEAIVRPGRLCAHIHTPILPRQQASDVYKRLTQDKSDFYARDASLAEVYRQARQDGWAPAKEPEHRGVYV